MRKLKLFFACLLMAVLSIGQMWAEDVTGTINFGSASGSTNINGASVSGDDSQDNEWTVKTVGTTSFTPNAGYAQVGSSSKPATSITFTMKLGSVQTFSKDNFSAKFGGFSGTAGTITLKVTNTSTDVTTSVGSGSLSATSDVTVKSSSAGTGDSLTVTVTGISKGVKVYWISYTYAGSSSDPSISADPDEVENVVVEGVTNQTIDLTYENITDYETEVSVHPNEDGTGTLSPAWLTASVTDADDYATVTYSVAANTGAARTAYIKVYTTDGDKEAETIIPVSQVKYSAPTGTFELFSGDLAEGEYVICSGTTALKNTSVAGPRIGYESVSVSESKIQNPDESLVWKIEALTGDDAGKWTIYNEAEEVYAAFNTADGRGVLLEEVTDYAKWTTSGSYDFINVGKTSKNYLRYNNGYGFASYASGTGAALTLYKKSDGKKNTGLAYSIANYLVKAGASLETPTLTNPNSLTGITYASSDADVVAVNGTTGALTIKAAGKAVITASRAEDETYKVGSASYTIYVAAQAGTAEDPLTEASAKALIDLGCGMDVYMVGTVATKNYYTTSKTYTVDLAGGMQYYYFYEAAGETVFETDYLKVGDIITAYGTLKKVSDKYRLNPSYMVNRVEYTEPLVDISNTKETAYTVAQALALAGNPTSDLTKAVYIAGVVYDVKSFNSTNGTLDIYIKDAGVENKFEFYKCAGIYDESLTAFTAADDVQVGDEVIGYGVMKYFSGGSIWEFDNTATGDYLVDLVRPEVAVSSVELDQNAASIEVNETVTLHATVNPENASNKAITWSVQSGNTYASVADGVVTGLVAGEAIIRAASTADPTKYAECTVTVTAADPSKHVVTFDATTDTGDSPLSKSNITFTCSSGALNNGSEYRLYKNSATTFECSVGNITKIEFTGVSGNPVSGFGDPEEGTLVTDGNDGVWTGNAASVSFVASGAQVRATEITVTYKEDNRAAAGLSWSTDAVVLTVGETFTAPTLNNPNSIASGEITIASDNEDLAIVTAGVVSLKADATGEATITATFDGNEDYKPATVSYTITVNEAGLDNVTFDATIDIAGTNELSITKGGFTLEFTGGAMGNGSEYRLYKNETMKLSSTAYYIKKIEFTCTSGNPISGFADAEGLDKANNQWTGQANSVELTASNAQVRIKKLKVYYIEDTRAVSGLAWSTDEIEITLGDAFTPATLNNPNSIDASAITIESDNTDLAIVTAGVVSLEPDKIGTAHITATFAGNETYKPATVSYTIIVNDPNPEIITNPTTYLDFGSVEEGATITAKTLQVTLQNVAAATVAITGDGKAAFSVDETALTGNITLNVSASSANQGTFNATLTISDNASLATAKEISLSLTVTEPVVEDDVTGTWTLVTSATTLEAGKKVIIAQYVDADGAINTMAGQASNNRSVIASTVAGTTLTPAVGTKVMTLADAGEGNFYLKTSDGEYLYNASTSSKSYLRTKAEEENVSWTIAVNAEGVATITSVENTNRINMRYNENGSNPALFNCYATGQNDIALYMHEDATPEPDYTEVRSGLEPGRYYTVCLPREVVAVKGATFWTLEKKNMEGSQAYLEEETNNLPFAAGKPFIIQATANKLEVAYEGDATEVAGTNGALHGTLVYMNAAALAAAGGNDVYMLFSNELRPVGENNHLDANRAYVLLSELNAVAEAPQNAPGRRVVAMPMEKDVTTDINALNAAEAPVKMIIDGNLFILRGEKLYDATGRLVK